ncbi:hypothetical protein Hanom_Chr16g01446501 [Helianthus anomalus]
MRCEHKLNGWICENELSNTHFQHYEGYKFIKNIFYFLLLLIIFFVTLDKE